MLITAGSLFTGAAQRFAGRPALADGTRYRELETQVNRFASGLTRLGVTRGERVAVLSHNRPELVTAWLGLERGGLVRVVLHSHFEMPVHVEMVRRTGAGALVFDTRFADAVEADLEHMPGVRLYVGLGGGCPGWAVPFREVLERGDSETAAVEVEEQEPVCIQPTTGTTGSPKPWVVSNRAWRTLVLHNLIHLGEMAPFGEDEVNLHVHALPWASGAQTLLPYMLHGAQTALLDDAVFDPAAIAAAIQEVGATGLLVPGAMLAPLLDAIEARPAFSHRLRRLVTLFCTPELLKRTTQVLGPVWCHAYGSTEQGAPVTRLTAREAADRPASVGRTASPLIQLAVLDPGGWFRSGDLGVLDAEGFLTYVDRSRDAISTSAGVVYPHEVEAAILRHEAVAGCGALGPPARPRVVIVDELPVVGRPADPDRPGRECAFRARAGRPGGAAGRRAGVRVPRR